MTFIAYGYIRRRLVQSSEHGTREAAATELWATYPKLKCVSTARAYNGRLTGSDIQFHRR